VTVKAADGTTQTVKARNPQNLKLLKVGDELVIGLYRAVAISLQKESGGPPRIRTQSPLGPSHDQKHARVSDAA
jgi:hypothetical protein